MAASIDSDLAEVLDWLAATDPLAEPAVEAKARLLLLDTVGGIVAALARPEPRALVDALARSDPGVATVPIVERAIGAMGAAAILGTAACWEEACEGLASAHGRPGLPVVAVALALAPSTATDYRGLLTALVAGYEVGGRLGEALSIRAGMHVDGTWHSFGAAVAAARLLGLDTAKTASAIAIAACQTPYSLYLPVRVGASARNTYSGHAAMLGLMSALAAEAGIGGPAQALATLRDQGWENADPPRLRPPGHWLVLDAYLKPFAAARHVHYGAAAAIRLRARLGANTRSVSAIELRVYDEAARYCGNRDPRTQIQAQFSLSFGVAAALALGDLGPEAYAEPCFSDPEIRRLERLVEIVADPELSQLARRMARLTLGTGKGPLSENADAVPGDAARPLDREAVIAKFRRYAGTSLGAAAEAMVERILDGPLSEPATRILRR